MLPTARPCKTVDRQMTRQLDCSWQSVVDCSLQNVVRLPDWSLQTARSDREIDRLVLADRTVRQTDRLRLAACTIRQTPCVQYGD